MRKIYTIILMVLVAISCIPAQPKAGIVSQINIGQSYCDAPKQNRQAIIIHYEGFTVSYNPQTLIPNWVSYELTADETNGPYSRKGKEFQQDPGLGVSQAEGNDYRGSGWARGHMAPAADFKWSDKAMSETFYYTNICPQDMELNNRYWNTLENKVRGWANQFGNVSVVTGPVIGKDSHRRIGANGVVVPDAFFKVILARTEDGWISIGFVMENTPDSRLFKECATTVNAVEALTGLDFFSSLDNSIEESVEDLLDYRTWKIY